MTPSNLRFIDKLINGLIDGGLTPDSRDVADMIWLAALMGRPVKSDRCLPPDQLEPDGNNVEGDAPSVQPDLPQPLPDEFPGNSSSTPHDLPSMTQDVPTPTSETQTAQLHLPKSVNSDGKRGAGRSFQTPAASALPQRLSLARSLRPLMRRVSSRTQWIFDEQKTVDQIAAGDVWWPVLCPKLVPRFQVALVIDTSVSMVVWRKTATQFSRLLTWTGAFPVLRTYHLQADGQLPTISRRMKDTDGRAALRNQVSQSGVATIVFVISDCVSAGWRNGSVFQLLEGWSQKSLTCLIQALPEVLWRRTALGFLPKIPLSNRMATHSNRRLEIRGEDPFFEGLDLNGFRLPITDFSPEGMQALAELVAGGTSTLCTGVTVVDFAPPSESLQSQTRPTARHRVDLFRQFASPIAQRLAELVAVSPELSLEVMRLIRGAMLPEARQTHEAEFLLGGLVYAMRSDIASSEEANHDVVLRFFDGVADLLLDSTPVELWLKVLDAVSRFVEPRLGRRLDGFRSLLVDPTCVDAEFEELTSEPFVRVALSRLTRLGGDYAQLATRLRSGAKQAVEIAPDVTPKLSEESIEGTGQSPDVPSPAIDFTTAGKDEIDFDQKIENVIPTLYIGLGGTGYEALMRLRRRLSENHWHPSQRYLSFLAIDTDSHRIRATRDRQDFQEIQLRSDAGEFVACGISAPEFQRVLAEARFKGDRRFAWMHPEIDAFSPQMFQDGSACCRQIGRLAFVLRYALIRATIQQQIREALDYAANASEDLFKTRGEKLSTDRLEIVVVTSLAGGTGSGMFLDIGYLIRDLVRNNPEFRQVRVQSTLIATMPSVHARYAPELGARFSQNGYAALRELEYYSTPVSNPMGMERDSTATEELGPVRARFRTMWGGTDDRGKLIAGTPWDICYLVGGSLNSKTFGGKAAGEVVDQIADYLYLDHGHSSFSIAKRSFRSNQMQLNDRVLYEHVRELAEESQLPWTEAKSESSTVFCRGFACCYGAFGLAEIFFDQQRVLRAASYRLAETLVRQRWLKEREFYSDDTYHYWVREDLNLDDGLFEREDVNLQRFTSFRLHDLIRDLLSIPVSKTNWLSQFTDEIKQACRANPPADSYVLRNILEQIQDALKRKPRETRSSVVQTFESRYRELSGSQVQPGTLLQYLRNQVRTRCNQIGVNPTLELIQHYGRYLEFALKQAIKLRSDIDPSIESLLAPVVKAERMMFAIRRFYLGPRIAEFQTAAVAAVTQWCARAASPFLELLYKDAISYLGTLRLTQSSLRDDPSLLQLLESRRELLTRIAAKFSEQFKQTLQSSSDRSRQSLIPDWSPDEYDRKIAEVLSRHPIVGPGTVASSNSFDLNRLAEQVLAILGTDQVRSPDGISECLDAWVSRTRQAPNDVSEICGQLTQVCHQIISESMGRSNQEHVLHRLKSLPEAERETRLDQLVQSSKQDLPLLRKPASSITPGLRNVLGISREDPAISLREFSRPVVDQIRGKCLSLSEEIPEYIHEVVESREHEIILVRELIGLPLHAFAEVEQLRHDYERSSPIHRNLCHLDYRIGGAELPELELSTPEQISAIQSNVLLILRAVVLGWIESDPDGNFIIRHQSQFGTKTISVGSRIERIIQLASRNQDAVSGMGRQWDTWRKTATMSQWAVFYFAVRQTLMLYARYHVLINGSPNQRSPVSECFMLIDMQAERDLKRFDPTGRLLGALKEDLPGTESSHNSEAPDPLLREAMRQRCIKIASPDVPIYQLSANADTEFTGILSTLGISVSGLR